MVIFCTRAVWRVLSFYVPVPGVLLGTFRIVRHFIRAPLPPHQIYVYGGYVSSSNSAAQLTDSLYSFDHLAARWELRTASQSYRYLHSAVVNSGLMLGKDSQLTCNFQTILSICVVLKLPFGLRARACILVRIPNTDPNPYR